MAKQTTPHSVPDTFPKVGRSRWKQLEPFMPMSRESWRKLVLAGRAPQPIRLSERCTTYDNAEVHRWLENPLTYKVEA